MKRALTKLRDFLHKYRVLPSYGEDSIFLLAVAVISLLAIDTEARKFALLAANNSSKVALIMLLGIGFSIYTAFFARFKSEVQKFYMFWFAVLVNVLSGIAIIAGLVEVASPFIYIFPAINIATAVLMIILWHADVLDTGTMPNRAASYSNIVYGGFAVVAFTLVAEYVLALEWPFVLSTAVGYATLFNRQVASHLPTLIAHRDASIADIEVLVNKAMATALNELNCCRLTFVCIVTKSEEKIEQVADEERSDLEFAAGEAVRQLPRTEMAAVATVGEYEYKRYWWGKTHHYAAVLVDVFPPGNEKGYQFCQMVHWDQDSELQLHKGLMYIGRIHNKLTT